MRKKSKNKINALLQQIEVSVIIDICFIFGILLKKRIIFILINLIIEKHLNKSKIKIKIKINK